MATFRWCEGCQTLHGTNEWPEACLPAETKRSDLPAPLLAPSFVEYRSPLGTGLIASRYDRREDLKRGGCREVDPSEFKPLGPVKPRAKWLKQHGHTAAS